MGGSAVSGLLGSPPWPGDGAVWIHEPPHCCLVPAGSWPCCALSAKPDAPAPTPLLPLLPPWGLGVVAASDSSSAASLPEGQSCVHCSCPGPVLPPLQVFTCLPSDTGTVHPSGLPLRWPGTLSGLEAPYSWHF